MTWRLIVILPIITFALSASSLLRGEFDRSGLAIDTLSLHTWVNIAESLGWIFVLVSMYRGWQKLGAQVAIFLAGMWCWDMITTMNLPMPVPPYQIIWGPLSVAIMLLLAYQLNKDADNAVNLSR